MRVGLEKDTDMKKKKIIATLLSLQIILIGESKDPRKILLKLFQWKKCQILSIKSFKGLFLKSWKMTYFLLILKKITILPFRTTFPQKFSKRMMMKKICQKKMNHKFLPMIKRILNFRTLLEISKGRIQVHQHRKLVQESLNSGKECRSRIKKSKVENELTIEKLCTNSQIRLSSIS